MRVLILLVTLLLPALAVAEGSPLLFEPQELDVGAVREGETVRVQLRVRNTGHALEEIVELRTSCGCTAAEADARVLLPGAFTRVTVSIDAFAKQNAVSKWIELVDGHGRTSRAILHLSVLPRAMHGATGRSLFDGQCRSCHFDPAIGKVDGAAIYEAVCAMCHGPEAQGAYAPALAGRNAGALMEIIANGTGRPQMPAFARKRGGPLDEEQIRALAEWIAALDAGQR